MYNGREKIIGIVIKNRHNDEDDMSGGNDPFIGGLIGGLELIIEGDTLILGTEPLHQPLMQARI